MRWANIAILLVLVSGISSAGFAAAPQSSQQPGQSVAAARKVLEKEKEAPKAKTVWTNDNIPSTPGGVSVVGQPAPSSPSTAAPSIEPAAGPANAPTEADKEKLAADRAKASSDLEDARKQLDSVKTDLDLAQREYSLDSAQLYSTPDYSKNQQGQARVDAEKATIATKQQAVDAAQKKVDDLEKLLKSLGGEEKPAPPPAPAPAAPPLKP